MSIFHRSTPDRHDWHRDRRCWSILRWDSRQKRWIPSDLNLQDAFSRQYSTNSLGYIHTSFHGEVRTFLIVGWGKVKHMYHKKRGERGVWKPFDPRLPGVNCLHLSKTSHGSPSYSDTLLASIPKGGSIKTSTAVYRKDQQGRISGLSLNPPSVVLQKAKTTVQTAIKKTQTTVRKTCVRLRKFSRGKFP